MKNIFIFFTIGLLMISCQKDFLEKVPLDFVSPDNYLSNDEQTEIVLNGVYNQLDFGGTTNPYQKTYPYCLDVATDDVFNRSPWEGMTDFARGQATPTNMRVGWKWSSNYQGISRANVLLDAIGRADYESLVKPRYSAEAKFLRAWYYNDLVIYFGDVPLILKPGDLKNAQPARDAKNVVVQQILKDLDEAIPVLPIAYESVKDKGRATKGAALALKARVLLYNSKWSEAAAAAKECMNLGVYSLYPDYRGLFKEENEAKASATEVIFQVYYTPEINPSLATMTLMVWWPSYLPTLQLANSYYMKNGLPITAPNSGFDPNNPYINRDPRLAASIYYPGALIKSAAMGINQEMLVPSWLLGGSGFKPKKFVSETLTNLENGEGLNKYFIRYAEVLLTYAEAKNEADGPGAEVYGAINQLRERAGMTTLSVAMPGLSKEQMREVIRNERRVELAFEGLRWPDIRRWKIGPDVMVDALGYDADFLKDGYYPGNGLGTSANWQYKTKIIDKRQFNPSRDYLWPIPFSEMSSNDNMVQNPYY
jgi:hypothetical protein